VPLLWFFAGREFGTARSLRALFATLVVSASIVAVYGLYQTWDGLPSWDKLWGDQSGYPALDVGTVIRAFGTFSSAAEYASFLGIAIVVAVAFAADRKPYLLPAVPLLAVALFYESGRAIIVTTVVAVIVVLAARTGSMARATVTLVVLLAGVVLAIVLFRGALEGAANSSNALVSHQVGGLLHPLNQQQSTLQAHLGLFENGFTHGVLDPIGYGIGSTTLAGAKLGTPQGTTSEVDLSNEFIALGTFGGLTYLAIVVLAVGAAIGVMNGLLIVKGRLNGFIVTLGMTIVLAGLQLGIVHGNTLFNLPPVFVYLGSASIGAVPVSFVVAVIIFVGVGVFLRYHRTGRAIYAVGGNLAAARAAGIKVDRIRIGVYVAGSILAAIGGLMEAGRVSAVTGQQGYQEGIIFSVFAAAVIGGVSLKGGRGNMVGAASGVILLGLVQNILDLANAPNYWIEAVTGGVILVALILARLIGGEATAE